MTHRVLTLGSSLVVSLLCILACDSDPLAPRSVQERWLEVTEGSPATAEEYDAVFFVEVTHESSVSVCTATLVAPRLLMTAAHCVTGHFGSVACETTSLGEVLPPSAFRVSSEADLSGTALPSWTFWEVEGAEILTPGSLLCGNDIGLLHLAQPIPESTAVSASVLSNSPEELSFQLVGYGAAHPSGTGERVRRFATELDVLCITPDECAETLVTGAAGAASVPAPATMNGEFVATPAGCPGDSGGPAWYFGAETNGLIGVLSRGSEDCSVNVYSRVPFELLATRVREISLEAGDEVPPWALTDVSIPEGDGGHGGEDGQGGTPSDSGGATQFDAQRLNSVKPGCSCSTGVGTERSAFGGGIAWLFLLVPYIRARRRSRC